MRRLFWVKEGMKLAGTVIAAGVVYALMMALLNGSDNSLEENINLGVLYLALFGSIMTWQFNISAYQSIIPMALSFGGTRKEVTLGIHIYRLSTLIPLVIVAGICTWYTSAIMEFRPVVVVTLMVSAYFFFSGVGAVLGTIQSKIGKTALTLISIVSMLLGMVLIGLGVFLLLIQMTLWFILGVAVIVYIVCSIFEVRAIKSYCVR